jgi:allophanate hydrolase
MAEELHQLVFTIESIHQAYRSGTYTVREVVEESLRRIASAPAGIWISIGDRTALIRRAADADNWLAAQPDALDSRPLLGIPYGVKDNIDVLGLATTAGCAAFSYQPACNAPVIELLDRAGAICMGKTNMDQFATGLVGVRSAFGECPNALNPDYISGGSSSGSAVAVAQGHVGFSLGTDTAGSGRVPAALNNIIGFKPTRGLLSTRGVVPACRSLDCVSIFTLLAADSWRVFQVLREPDADDEFSIADPPEIKNPAALPPVFNVGIPRPDQLEFFGDSGAQALFGLAVERIRSLGGRIIEIDFSPFQEAGELLYNGPWIVERYAGLKPFVASHPDNCLPVIKEIFSTSSNYSARDVFAALHRRRTLLMKTRQIWNQIQTLVLPTAPTIYRRSQIHADPIRLNTNLGYYTRFANLMKCCVVAVPAAIRSDGLPFGISLVAPAFNEHKLIAMAGRFHADTSLTMGALAAPVPDECHCAGKSCDQMMDIAVVGAHLSGQPLNYQLIDVDAHFVREARTAPCYRLSSLGNAKPAKPGLVRVASGGGAIRLEIWRMPHCNFGAFLALVPSPLCIGSITLEDRTTVKGFLCESVAAEQGRDITSFGGWREFLIEDR